MYDEEYLVDELENYLRKISGKDDVKCQIDEGTLICSVKTNNKMDSKIASELSQIGDFLDYFADEIHSSGTDIVGVEIYYEKPTPDGKRIYELLYDGINDPAMLDKMVSVFERKNVDVPLNIGVDEHFNRYWLQELSEEYENEFDIYGINCEINGDELSCGVAEGIDNPEEVYDAVLNIGEKLPQLETKFLYDFEKYMKY